MTVKDFLNSKGINYRVVNRRNSGIQYIIECPKCGHKDCFAISPNGMFNCFRQNKCGISGNFDKFQGFYGAENIKLTEDKNVIFNKKERKFTIPKIANIKLSNSNYEYLKNMRHLTCDTINKFKLFNGIRGEICFPSIKNEEIVNVEHYLPATNNIKKQIWGERNAEKCLFGQDNVEGDDYLLICEGKIDCCSLYQYGLENVVSVPSGVNDLSWIENDFEFLDKFKEIYLCMDADVAGQGSVNSVVARLGSWRVKSILLPYKDANECLQNGVTSEEIIECFENAKEFDPVELKTAGDFCEEVLDMFRNPKKYEGIPSGIPELDAAIKGFRKGEITIWSGQSGSGKTTILNQIFLSFGSIGIKVCVASLELRPARYLKWAIEQYVGSGNPNESDIIKTFKNLNEWFYVLDIDDNVNMDKIFNTFEYTARKYGAEQFVIDSLMRIKLNEQGDNFGELKSQKEFINRLDKFCKKFNVHGHLVAHPRKQDSDSDKPTKSDISGTSNITDLSDNCIITWRVPDKLKCKEEDGASPDAILFIRKNREYGKLSEIPLNYDPYSRRFSPFNK